jgi:hypothetical protein
LNDLLKELEEVVTKMASENAQLRAALARLQRPEHEEDVADWLRKRGYIVIRPLESNGND